MQTIQNGKNILCFYWVFFSLGCVTCSPVHPHHFGHSCGHLKSKNTPYQAHTHPQTPLITPRTYAYRFYSSWQRLTTVFMVRKDHEGGSFLFWTSFNEMYCTWNLKPSWKSVPFWTIFNDTYCTWNLKPTWESNPFWITFNVVHCAWNLKPTWKSVPFWIIFNETYCTSNLKPTWKSLQSKRHWVWGFPLRAQFGSKEDASQESASFAAAECPPMSRQTSNTPASGMGG